MVPLFFFHRGWKDFICREFSWRKEKRKTAYLRMQGDPETSDPYVVPLGDNEDVLKLTIVMSAQLFQYNKIH
jgi:hypothetical protein